jgi:hypothetical protein
VLSVLVFSVPADIGDNCNAVQELSAVVRTVTQVRMNNLIQLFRAAVAQQ